MRFSGVALVVFCVGFMIASSAWAGVPDCLNSYVDPESVFINASPRVVFGTDAERVVVVIVALVEAGSGIPLAGYPAGNFSFTVIPHNEYPNLGGGPGGGFPGCEGWFWATCLDLATNIDGEMRVEVGVGPFCAPSMCCPVRIRIHLAECTMAEKINVLQNTHDLVTAGGSLGIVNLSDISAFTTALAQYYGSGIPQPCADYVFSPEQTQWGQLSLSDIAAFAIHINEACNLMGDPCR